jgi:hypothetical protein
MYKRYTFGASCLSLGTRFGVVKQKSKIMKMLETEVRNKMVVVRMNEAELKQLEKMQQKTTEKNTSTYLRKVALQKPVTVKYRNVSADDFLLDVLNLKKELNAIGNNFNQAVHKLHLLDKIPEFRQWIQQYDRLHNDFISKTEQINLKVNELYEQWLLK